MTNQREDTAAERLAVRITPDLKRRIRAAARAERRTVSMFAVLAFEERLARIEEKA